MLTNIRCHVKTDARLSLLEQAIQSCLKEKVDELGPITIVDDDSPLSNQVKQLAEKYHIGYLNPQEYKPSTNQGLCNALKLAKDEPYSLQLCDDIVLCNDFRSYLNKVIKYGLVGCGEWGVVTAFCPQSVAMHLRKGSTFNDTNLYRLDTKSPLIHAMICTLVSNKAANAYVNHWEMVRGTDKEQDHIMDDLRLRAICNHHQLGMYMTKRCLAEHTGTNDRTFVDPRQGGSQYRAADFVK